MAATLEELERRVAAPEAHFRPSHLDSGHVWQGISGSHSGMWICQKCGLARGGGAHDGGPYFPGRGQDVPPCPGWRNA